MQQPTKIKWLLTAFVNDCQMFGVRQNHFSSLSSHFSLVPGVAALLGDVV